MNTATIASFAYKGFCIILCILLLVGALGFIDQKDYYQAAIGAVGLVSVIPLAIRKPSFKSLGFVILITAATMYLVGLAGCYL